MSLHTILSAMPGAPVQRDWEWVNQWWPEMVRWGSDTKTIGSPMNVSSLHIAAVCLYNHNIGKRMLGEDDFNTISAILERVRSGIILGCQPQAAVSTMNNTIAVAESQQNLSQQTDRLKRALSQLG